MTYTPPTYKEFAPLPNARRLSEFDVARSPLGSYTPVRVFAAEVEITPEAPDEASLASSRHEGRSYALVTALTLADGTGYAFKTDYRNGRVLWWRFGACLHENQTQRTVGRCLTRYTCADCGYTHDVDSSD